jgi:DNA-binding NarL/FixJ family response regulator
MGRDPMKSELIRVLVVEDSDPFRAFTCSTLATRENLQVICESSDGLQAVQKAKELQPDLILLDIGLPLLDGIAAARHILEFSSAKIIFLTQESDREIVACALALGAPGYVLKARASADLLAAIEAVCEGGKFVSPGLVEQLTRQAELPVATKRQARP